VELRQRGLSSWLELSRLVNIYFPRKTKRKAFYILFFPFTSSLLNPYGSKISSF
jgi:hypothetical protein